MLPTGFWERVVFLFFEYSDSFAHGIYVTMVIATISTLIGCIIGFGVGIVQTIPTERKERPFHWFMVKIVQLLLNAYVELFRGTPMMVQAMFIYYGIAMVFGITMNMWTAAIFIVSINTGAYMAESVRGGILSIDNGQTEGAKAIGMTHFQTMIYVVLPQALRNIMPQIGNNLIVNIKDSCVLSVIGTVEVFYTTKSVAGTYYTYFEAFTIAMVIYFLLTFICSRILRYFENRMDGPDNYELAATDPKVAAAGTYRFNDKKAKRFAEMAEMEA
ncbi:MAG: amino acid ABC transporter permease [Firmicutes bacterium]|nr:amino acid ABC transporter permease [Bacillota bacterium]MBQ9972336.1 amino acid ABC transporter permease [Bacillota bacterium]